MRHRSVLIIMVIAGLIMLMSWGSPVTSKSKNEIQVQSTRTILEGLVVAQYKKITTYRHTEVFMTENEDLSYSKAKKMAHLANRYAKKWELNPDLIAAIILVESGARPNVVSSAGARGLMQVMPSTARLLNFKEDLFDIDSNIKIGTFILAENIKRHGYTKGIQVYFWGNTEPSGSYLKKVINKLAYVQGDF